MSLSVFPGLGFVGFCAVLGMLLSAGRIDGAAIVAASGEAGFRAAIAAAQPGDTVRLTNQVVLSNTVVIDKRITLSVNPADAWRISIEGTFDGELLNLAADGIALHGLRLYGSPQTDALRLEDSSVTLRDCMITGFRQPVVSEGLWEHYPSLRLERVTVIDNDQGISCLLLDAVDCTFANNGGYGVWGWNATLEGCLVERNAGFGFSTINGTVKNCVFRYNTGIGLYFDPDNGYLCLSSSLFYANSGGGLYLREGAYVTVDNCTFTRHTGAPAVIVTEAHNVLFRHCTIADNLVLGGGDPWSYPYYPSGASFWLNSFMVELQNCFVADNPVGDDNSASGLVGDWIDLGGNVIGGPAHLSSLRDNGGPLLSLLPLAGSPAINAGRPSDVVVDARGLSRHAGSAPDAGAIETDAGPSADTDADGLPDIWERFRGLNPDSPADAASDADADGQNALAEFRSGTNPVDPQSVHRAPQLFISPSSIFQAYPQYGYLSWTRYPAVFYALEVSHDLRTWRRIPGGSGGPGGTELGWSLGEVPVDAPPTFYRVVATKQ